MKEIVAVILILLGIVRPTAQPAEPLRFVTITAGADHACALTDRGQVFCWGSNQFGQLGTGPADALPHTRPVRVAGGLTFTTVVAGFTHTCGIVREGAAYCWGANDTAQLGDGTITPKSIPVRVATDVRFKAIGPGGTHTCAVGVDGIAYCWGGNWHGQLGAGNRDGDAAAPCCFRLPTPIRTELRFQTAIAGGIHSCAVAANGKAYCWGSPQQGRLGSGDADAKNKSADKTVPTAVAGDVLFATIAPRSWHTCGLSSTGTAFCWGGAGEHGVLGPGNSTGADSPVPSRVALDANVATVVTGHLHNCALTRDGVASCWGANADGEIGDGTTRDASATRRVTTTGRFVSIATGGNVSVSDRGIVSTWGFTCAVTVDTGTVLCWGDNRHGELGNGSTTGALTPAPISNAETSAEFAGPVSQPRSML
jgi:alpha-tubulin suppressor-like RCC1 family protein